MTVGNEDRESQRRAADEVVGDGSVTIDLTDPPSRSDLGVTEGRKTVMLQRDEREPFEVTVRFSDGHVLTTTAMVLGVHTDGGDTAPHSLTIRRDSMTLTDLEEALLAAQQDLGADPQRVADVLEDARTATSGSGDVIRALPTALDGDERLEIEPVVTADEGRVSVNYLVSWGSR